MTKQLGWRFPLRSTSNKTVYLPGSWTAHSRHVLRRLNQTPLEIAAWLFAQWEGAPSLVIRNPHCRHPHGFVSPPPPPPPPPPWARDESLRKYACHRACVDYDDGHHSPNCPTAPALWWCGQREGRRLRERPTEADSANKPPTLHAGPAEGLTTALELEEQMANQRVERTLGRLVSHAHHSFQMAARRSASWEADLGGE